MMIWNASGVPVWQVAFVWAGVILFWGFVIWAGKVVLGNHDHIVVQPDVVDGDAGRWVVGHGDTDRASGEILP